MTPQTTTLPEGYIDTILHLPLSNGYYISDYLQFFHPESAVVLQDGLRKIAMEEYNHRCTYNLDVGATAVGVAVVAAFEAGLRKVIHTHDLDKVQS